MTSQFEADETRRPYMRLWIDDVRGSCQDMSAAQFGAHMRMLMHAWERGCVPANERKLRRIVGDIEWDEMDDVIKRWQGDGECYRNARLERERERITEQSNRRAQAGKSGAQAKRKQTSSNDEANDEQTPSNDQANGQQSHSPIVPQSQTPITPDAQTPIHSSDGRKAPSKRRGKSTDPLGWNESDGWVGLTDEDFAKWLELFPAVDAVIELKRLDQWLRDNPTKAHKSHWRRWVNKLFGIKQEKGGTRSAGGTPAASGPNGFRKNRDHIPDHCRPEDEALWWDGAFPRIPMLYFDRDGNQRLGETREIFIAAKPKLQLTTDVSRSTVSTGETQ